MTYESKDGSTDLNREKKLVLARHYLSILVDALETPPKKKLRPQFTKADKKLLREMGIR
jgi:hypothetical protein